MGKTYDYPTAYPIEAAPGSGDRSFLHKANKHMKHIQGIVEAGTSMYTTVSDAMDARAAKKYMHSDGSSSSTKPAVVIDATTKDRKGSSTVNPGTASTSTPAGNTSFLHGELPSIGASSTLVCGNSWAPTLKLKLGKQVSVRNPYLKMLEAAQGSGTVTTTFGGYMTCPQDKRVRCYHSFRHRLYNTGAENLNSSYPSVSGKQNHILTPSNTVVPDLGRYAIHPDNNTTLDVTLANQPFQEMKDGYQYSAPLNCADYEDMSWNLNRFKLGWDASAKSPTFLPDADYKLASAKHRGNSAIYANNVKNPNLSTVTPEPSPYRYNMVFNKGTVSYTMMNKGDSPLQLELIVYKVKKTQQLIGKAASGLDFEQFIEDPVKQGFTKNQVGYIGTDDVGGRAPDGSDVVTNPRFPFLPQTKSIAQGVMPFREVERVRVTIQSGERRPIVLELGGDEYDPVNKSKKGVHPSGQAIVPYTPQMDDSCYVICIGLCGTLSSRTLEGPNPSVSTMLPKPFLLGDMYGSANLQFYGAYEERISACVYKGGRGSKIYVKGALTDIAESVATWNATSGNSAKQVTATPTVLLPQSAAVRLPAQATFGTNSGGNTITQSTAGTRLSVGAEMQMEVLP